MLSSYKKIFLLGFIITILIAIPFSVYMVQQRQQTNTKAAPSTVLSIEPATTTISAGDTLDLNIILNPGSNQVSFAKFAISFDPKAFTVVNGLTPNAVGNTLVSIIDEAQTDNTAGKVSISLSIGSDPTKAVTSSTKVATFRVKGIAATAPTGPNFTFDTANTQILSIASSDQTSENVLSSTTPSTITVTAAAVTPSPTITTTSAPTSAPTSPYTTGTPSPTPTLIPICSSLDIDGFANGAAPYPLTFTATGSDPNGIISKVTFNFGDSTEDLITGGGIGTSSVSAQLIHTYSTPGIYTAYATMTDNDNNLSIQQINCTKTITITSTQSAQITILPSLPPTGDGNTMLGLGILGVIITIIGGALLIL